MKLRADVVRNSTGEILESSDFTSQAALETWKQGRESIESFGSEFEMSIVVHDETSKHEEELEIADRTEAREFCLYVIDMIAAYNQKNKTQAEVQAIFSTPAMGAITLALLTGGIKTARMMIGVVGPSLYPAEFVTRVLSDMDQWIAVNEPAPESQDETPENPPEGGSSSQPV